MIASTQITSTEIFEFPKLRALRAFVPYAPSCLTRLRVLRAFAPYVPCF